MKRKQLEVLLVEDNPGDVRLIQTYLKESQDRIHVVHAPDLKGACSSLAERSFDIVLLDLGLPDAAGLEAVEGILDVAPHALLVVLTGDADELTAIEALKKGAHDYLVKSDISAALLIKSLRYALERQGLESEMRKLHRLESVGQLAGGVAHDFNNLLAIIQGHCDVIGGLLSKGDPVAAEVAEILRCCTRGANLTEQLLTFSRDQALPARTLDLGRVVSGVESMLRRVMGDAISLVLDLGDETCFIKADEGQLEQILLNLVLNARDALCGEGTIAIEIRAATIGADGDRSSANLAPGPYAELSVRDNGHGMDADTQARAFEPFFTTKEVGKGTGLGLATVYGIATQAGGDVEIESALGKGTTISVFFPRVEAESDAALDQRTVLVVDDDVTVRVLLDRMLSSLGFQVVLASCAKDAVRSVEAGTEPELVILDLLLDGTTAQELVADLRASCPDLCVLYMSGFSADIAEQRGLRSPGSPFLQKPFLLDELATQLRAALEPVGS